MKMKLLFLVASAHAFDAGFGEIAEDWDCSKYDENDKEAYMKEGIDKNTNYSLPRKYYRL